MVPCFEYKTRANAENQCLIRGFKMALRGAKGRYVKTKPTNKTSKLLRAIKLDHNYTTKKQVLHAGGLKDDHRTEEEINLPRKVSRDGWRVGRRIVEFGVLLDNLEFCEECGLGPVSLTKYSIVGELRKGLSGFFYVRCSNGDCEHINRVTYGKTHRLKAKGMPCFAVNTKLGIGKL